MAKTIYLTGQPYKRINSMIKRGEDFEVVRTSRTAKIKRPGKSQYLYSPSKMNTKQFSLLSRIKKEIKDNLKQVGPPPSLNKDDVNYYCHNHELYKCDVSKEPYVVCENGYEFDVNKAYYQIARNLGYISQEFFEECLNVDKSFRLMLIGSIAGVKRVYKYKNGELVGEPEVKKNEDLRRVWFHICKTVDDCLKDLMELCNGDFIFYWVDGIYLKEKRKVENKLNYLNVKYGLEFDEKPIKDCRVYLDKNNQRMLELWKWDHDKQKFKRKTFNLKTNISPQDFFDNMKKDPKDLIK